MITIREIIRLEKIDLVHLFTNIEITITFKNFP